MELKHQELTHLETSHLSIKNAKTIAKYIEKDPTVGGIFPKGASGDYTNIDSAKFQSKYCNIWTAVRPTLIVAKIFTGEHGDKIIDKMINTGDTLCPIRN